MKYHSLLIASACFLQATLFANFETVTPSAPTKEAVTQRNRGARKNKKPKNKRGSGVEMARNLMKDNAATIFDALQGPWQGRRNAALREVMALSTTNRQVIKFLTNSNRGPGAQRWLDAILAESVNPPFTCATPGSKLSHRHAVALRAICMEAKRAAHLPTVARTADADNNHALNELHALNPDEQQLIWDLLKAGYDHAARYEIIPQ